VIVCPQSPSCPVRQYFTQQSVSQIRVAFAAVATNDLVPEEIIGQ